MLLLRLLLLRTRIQVNCHVKGWAPLHVKFVSTFSAFGSPYQGAIISWIYISKTCNFFSQNTLPSHSACRLHDGHGISLFCGRDVCFNAQFTSPVCSPIALCKCTPQLTHLTAFGTHDHVITCLDLNLLCSSNRRVLNSILGCQ